MTSSHYLKRDDNLSITGGGFNVSGTIEGAKQRKKSPENILKALQAAQRSQKKNFVDFNKDVRSIMNQKKIERYRKQLQKDREAWEPTVVT